jgi:hypothetical protein
MFQSPLIPVPPHDAGKDSSWRDLDRWYVTGIRKQNRHGPVVIGGYGDNVMARDVGFENTTVRLVLARKLAPVGPVWGSDIAEELSVYIDGSERRY